MKVQLLYFDGCPNWRHTLEEINAVLREYQLPAEVELVKVTSQKQAHRLGFLGSPTVRIDDVDVEPDIPESGYGLERRLYWVGDRPLGRPPREWIAARVEATLE